MIKINSIYVRKYTPNDYVEVNRIFVDGVNENIINGIIRGLKHHHVISYMMFFFFIGSFFSFYYGCIGILVGSSINSLSVYLAIKWYIWYTQSIL